MAAGGGGGGGSGGGGAKASSGGGSEFYPESGDVVNLNDDNFASEVLSSDAVWLVEFYAPWCGHCKNLKPAWTSAASSLVGKAKLGAIDCTANEATCGRYGVRGYPTIKTFGADKDAPADYAGGRDSGSIVDFATKLWSEAAPPPEVREIFDDAALESACVGDRSSGTGAKQLCLLAFLPHILDSGAKGREDYLSVLRKLSDKYKARPFGYGWAEAGKQPAIEAEAADLWF